MSIYSTSGQTSSSHYWIMAQVLAQNGYFEYIHFTQRDKIIKSPRYFSSNELPLKAFHFLHGQECLLKNQRCI